MTRRRKVSGGMAQITALALLLAANGMMAQSLGSAFTYQGQLKELGQPASGLYDLQACLFDTPSNPIPLACAPDFNDVPVESGLFAITLDFGSAPFVGQQRFLELRVRPGASGSGYTILAPRQLIRPAPEALRSNVAAAAPWSGLTGVPAGFADGTDNDSGGTVTNIATGAGLTGGPITGSGSIAVAAGGIGAAQINPSQVQSRVTGTCAVGLFVRSVNQDGTVVCDPAGVGSITGVTAGTGLTGGGTSGAVTVGIAPGGVGATEINQVQVQSRVVGNCAVGEYVRAVNQDGTVVCDDDANSGGSVTSIATGAGLAGGPITGSGTIAVADGGIGATQINPSQVQTRVVGVCPIGEFVRGVNEDGSVVCNPSPPVPPVPTITTVVDPSGDISSLSLAIGGDGLPVISFRDNEGNVPLSVAKCLDIACAGGATITVVDSQPASGTKTAIAIGSDGFPVISYAYQTPGDIRLMVAKCSSHDCTGSTEITTVDDSANYVGDSSSIAIGSDGAPVISYRDATANALKVAKCANAACTGSATITTVDDPVGSVGFSSSIAIGNDGLPIIGYDDGSANALKVAKCANAACSAGTIITVVDNQAGQSRNLSIALGSDGKPVISYSDSIDNALKVAKCANAACTGTAVITTVDDPPAPVGASSSIAISSDGLPTISYSDESGQLLVAKCTNLDCSGAVVFSVIDNQSGAGRYNDIAIGTDGLPVIAYRSNAGGGSMRVAKCGTPSCK